MQLSMKNPENKQLRFEKFEMVKALKKKKKSL